MNLRCPELASGVDLFAKCPVISGSLVGSNCATVGSSDLCRCYSLNTLVLLWYRLVILFFNIELVCSGMLF